MKTILRCCLALSLFSLPVASAADSGAGAYARLLQRVATDQGIRWTAFGKDEKLLLTSFLDWSAATNPVTLGDRNEQLAFWVNAHNACVMKLIADHLPLENVMTISGFRDRLKCKIAGGEYSLVELESNILRPLFNEPRIHFVLWWGTKGGPRLRSTPYEGKNLENKLEEATRRALENPLFVRFDAPKTKTKEMAATRAKKEEKEKLLALSPIFDWYKTDFGPKPAGLLAFVRTHLPPDDAKKVPATLSEAYFTSFDWTLDSAP